ncbi:GNAT family N-acetyltransferase [Raineya sp.]|jgi:GNAT superfamily N-acetyltransferase
MYLTEILSNLHQKSFFDCGIEVLNEYLKKIAGQDIRRKLAACYVFVENAEIKGYYTLSSSSIFWDTIPEAYRKKLPSAYRHIPVILLGRLAVDRNAQKLGLGGKLLIDALKRSYETSNSIGAWAVVVEPISEQAQAFYQKYGFILLPDSKKMFLPMKTIEHLFRHL